MLGHHVTADAPDFVTAGALMHELEAILHEYLSFNWDRMEEMSAANAPCQRKDGLACPWGPSRDIQHSVSNCITFLGALCMLLSSLSPACCANEIFSPVLLKSRAVFWFSFRS